MPNLGTTEILLVLAVVILLFGAKKLPELARGSGKALRIFKTEVKALHDDDDDEVKPASLESVKATETDKKTEQG
ncbi:Sec-independent protein translocase subunit TatA [Aeromicrobium sp. NPDC092404]|uniref:Sec-independent protein translocase subunit TatA n=1 Tax=Aeromicrobium sp. NPDC092404 TaxID=3154976 RepID=UPI003418DE9D